MKWAGRFLFLVLFAAFLVSLLPTLDVVDLAKRDFHVESESKVAEGIDAAKLNGMALQVRSKEVDFQRKLRLRLVDDFAAEGVTEIADNSTAYPRLSVTVTNLSGQWTPFYSTTSVTVHAQLDMDKRRDRDVPFEGDVLITVEGTEVGLVSKREFLNEPADKAARAVLQHLIK